MGLEGTTPHVHLSALYTQVENATHLTPEIESRVNQLAQSILANPDQVDHNNIDKALDRVYTLCKPNEQSRISNIHENWKITLAVNLINQGGDDENARAILPTDLHIACFIGDPSDLDEKFIIASSNLTGEVFENNSFGKTPVDYALEQKQFSAIENGLSVYNSMPEVEIPGQQLINIFIEAYSDNTPSQRGEVNVLLETLETTVEIACANENPHSGDLQILASLKDQIATIKNDDLPLPVRARALTAINDTPLSHDVKEKLTMKMNQEFREIQNKLQAYEDLKAGKNKGDGLTDQDVISLAASEGNYGLIDLAIPTILNNAYRDDITVKTLRNLNDQIAISSFLLDKTIINDGSVVARGNFQFQSKIFADAFAKTAIQLCSNPQTPIENELHQNIELIGGLKISLALNSYLSVKTKDFHLPLIMEFINMDPPAIPILIPIGTSDHAMGLSIKPNGDGFATVSIYNTGEAVINYHPNDPETNQAQTALHYINVPMQDVTNPQLLKELLECRTQKDIGQVYEKFANLVANGDMVEDNSPGNMESVQMKESCVAQYLMAFLRGQMTQHVEGSREQGLGIYKFLKNELLNSIGENHGTNMQGEARSFNE